VTVAGAEGLTQYIVTRANNSWRLSQFSDAGIAYATTNLNPSLRALSRYKLARTIDRFRPDVIQYWKARAGRFTIARHKERSLAWHGGTARPGRMSGCGWHLGSSPQVVTDLLEKGVDEPRVFHVPPFAGRSREAPVSRKDLGVPAGAPLALVLSRLHAKKGLTTLMEAVRTIEGLHVLIAGDGSMRGALRAHIKAQRLDDRVHLLGWRNDGNELMKLADFVICPSRIEPFGKIVIEAWAAAKPIIAADAVGPSTLITPGKTGTLVRRGDDEALAAAIQEMISHPSLAHKMGAAGREAYNAEYGETIFVEQMLSIYQQILKTAGPF